MRSTRPGGSEGRVRRSGFDRGKVRLLAPIPQPPQMRDFLCFEKHLQQAFQAARMVRARNAGSGSRDARDGSKGHPGVAAGLVRAADLLSPEPLQRDRPESTCPGRPIRNDGFRTRVRLLHRQARKEHHQGNARDHIFGYTIFNDFSARDEQTKEMPGQLGPGKGKDFDGSNAMGPASSPATR